MTTTFSCPECGGKVAPRTGKNRLFELRRGVPPLALPESLSIPQCSGCGELFVPEDRIAEVEACLRGPYLAWQAEHLCKLTDLLAERHRLTKGQVARLAGVTPSHLSHLLAGAKDMASETLLRLIEAFAKCSAEVERHKAGLPFDISKAPAYHWNAPRVARVAHAPKRAAAMKARLQAFTKQPAKAEQTYKVTVAGSGRDENNAS